MTTAYQPKTGAACYCRRGVERDNCANCEGTGYVIDFAAIRAATAPKSPAEERRRLAAQRKAVRTGALIAAASNTTAAGRCAHDVAMSDRCFYCKREAVSPPASDSGRGDRGAVTAATPRPTKTDWGLVFLVRDELAAYKLGYDYRNSPHGYKIEPRSDQTSGFVVTVWNEQAKALGCDV